ncbi:MAG: 2-C-methyl-D-erythritol 2,4-cyclodiphosphate synthase [Collinsella sp.]|nr:2-C-methyl-D-erythritol 2,4-cyclodiphosphate synthase [Collinsella sp.]
MKEAISNDYRKMMVLSWAGLGIAILGVAAAIGGITCWGWGAVPSGIIGLLIWGFGMVLLARVMDYARELGFEFVDADCTIACQQPKITPHRDAMRANLAHALGVDVENVGVAATTTEKLGWEGQGEGIGAWAVCLLQKTVKE